MLDRPFFSPKHYRDKETEPGTLIFDGYRNLWARTKVRFARLRHSSREVDDGAAVQSGGDLSYVETELERAFERPKVKGKFLFVGDEKFWVRGVTYGTFRPDESGTNFLLQRWLSATSPR